MKKSKNPRMPVIPPVQKHRDRKNNPLRKPKHQKGLRVKLVEQVDADWQDF